MAASLTYTLVFNGNNISLNRTSVSGLVLYLSVSVLHNVYDAVTNVFFFSFFVSIV